MRRGRERILAVVVGAAAVAAAVAVRGVGDWPGPGSWWVAAGLAVSLAVCDLLPLAVETRRTTISFPGYEIFLFAGLALTPGQVVLAGAVGASIAGSLLGRVSLGPSRTPVPPRRVVCRSGALVLGLAAAVATVSGLDGPEIATLAAGVLAFSLVQTGVAMGCVALVAGRVPGVSAQLVRSYVTIAQETAILVPLAVLVGLSLRGMPAAPVGGVLLMLLLVYVVVVRALTVATAGSRRKAALLEAARTLHASTTGEQVRERLVEAARTALSTESVTLSPKRVDGALLQSFVGDVGGQMWWLVVPDDRSGDLDHVRVHRELLDALAAVGGSAWVNADRRERLSKLASQAS